MNTKKNQNLASCHLWGSMLLSSFLMGCGPSSNDASSHTDAHEAAHQGESSLPCVVVSTTDVLGIVQAIAGDAVELHCFGKGNQDPHALDILPSYVREMNDADLWIQVGNDIEAAWYPDLISNVKNTKILDGQEGFLDLSQGLIELEGVVGKAFGASQSSGLHPSGNPHYLLDPMEGIRAGKMILDRLIALVPSQKETFQENFKTFRQSLSEALIGQALAERHDIVEIADHYLNDTLSTFLAEQDHNLSLEGWLGALDKHRGTVIVGDHDLWPYFARRVGLSVLGYFEPEPGVPPTTKHLRILMDEMKTQSVSVIFSAPYFDSRHAVFVSENTGARVLPMCHQTQARPDTSSYFDMIRHNMETVIQALSQ